MNWTSAIGVLCLVAGAGLGMAARPWIESIFATKAESKDETDDTGPQETAQEINLYQLADALDDFYTNSAHPMDLLSSSDFMKGVEHLARAEHADDTLIAYAYGDNELIACMALEALHHRSGNLRVINDIATQIGSLYVWPFYFALRALSRHAQQPIISAVIIQARPWWPDNVRLLHLLDRFMADRITHGETPTFGNLLVDLEPEQIGYITQCVNKLDTMQAQPLLDELNLHQESHLDSSYLNSVGHLKNREDTAEAILEHTPFRDSLQQIEYALFKEPFRSVLLVGENGVGKTTLVNALVERLERRGWRIFEAGMTEVLAGQSYIGELEDQIQKLVHHLDRRRSVIWYIPNFHEMHMAGRHRYNPTGVLDMLLPHVESGLLQLIGETTPTAFERLLRDNRRLQTMFDIMAVLPLGDRETVELAYHWTEQLAKQPDGAPTVSHDAVQEAWLLCRQYLGDRAAPGNLLDFLKQTRQYVMAEGGAPHAVSIDALYISLSRLTGLPRAILDEQQGLDLGQLRQYFQQRVMGQPEAIECLVERVAMVKAGLVDPTRPCGVFLFAGPTGTGKTEIAKALSEFLFGSLERMIRLDMSELNTWDSEDRILGSTERDQNNDSLVHRIRQHPFSVVLLDEFEKAHSHIWDLFLQVFDDGRLTDRLGNTADFRHAMIILTSNLGATIHPGSSVGFNAKTAAFSLHQVEQAITRTFRREFVNRLDRVVIFRPLGMSVMRQILAKELNDVLHRRGLRNREWAVEWEDSAIDFLLQTGFTPDLGARPLKRAIERYFLSPLALAIVDHQLPEGDQFLFVRADGDRIEVEFIDPDALEPSTPPAPLAVEPAAGAAARQIKTLVLEAWGTAAEAQLLQEAYEALAAQITAEAWVQNKHDLLQQMSSASFWDSPDRFRLLGEVEFMDRIEAGLKGAASLLRRLTERADRFGMAFARELIPRLAQQLYLLQEACQTYAEARPQDAFLRLETGYGASQGERGGDEFARRLLGMYQRWAQKRRMHLQVVQTPQATGGASHTILAVSGFGAYAILTPESGLHVWEIPEDNRMFDRHTVRVRVAAQPEDPTAGDASLLSQAQQAFATLEAASPTIVRRYREQPSPLVRDSVRQWRTGRLDRVLDGDFDILS